MWALREGAARSAAGRRATRRHGDQMPCRGDHASATACAGHTAGAGSTLDAAAAMPAGYAAAPRCLPRAPQLWTMHALRPPAACRRACRAVPAPGPPRAPRARQPRGALAQGCRVAAARALVVGRSASGHASGARRSTTVCVMPSRASSPRISSHVPPYTAACAPRRRLLRLTEACARWRAAGGADAGAPPRCRQPERSDRTAPAALACVRACVRPHLRQKVVARTEEREERGRDGGHAGADRDGGLGALQRGELGGQHLRARGVGRAALVGAPARCCERVALMGRAWRASALRPGGALPCDWACLHAAQWSVSRAQPS